jgi:hypothetical protein
MKNISFLKISRSILLASVMMGIGVIGHAQRGAGTDSPGQDPSTSGGTLTGPGSDNPQGGPASGQGMTGKKASPTSSSKKQ